MIAAVNYGDLVVFSFLGGVVLGALCAEKSRGLLRGWAALIRRAAELAGSTRALVYVARGQDAFPGLGKRERRELRYALLAAETARAELELARKKLCTIDYALSCDGAHLAKLVAIGRVLDCRDGSLDHVEGACPCEKEPVP